MEAPWAKRWDRVEDFKKEEDLGWIGEDGKGIWMTLHPMAALHLLPEMEGVYDAFAWGCQNEITQSDWECLSYFEFMMKRTMVVALNRGRLADGKESKRGDPGQGQFPRSQGRTPIA